MNQNGRERSVIPFASGLCAGFVSTALLHPLDLIKTRFQVDEGVSRHRLRAAIARLFSFKPPGFDNVTGSSTKSIAVNLRNTTYTIHKQLGFLGLYRGLLPAIIGSSASWAIYWFVYEYLKKQAGSKCNSQGGRLSSFQYLGCSLMAGSCTTLLTNPIWLIKTRMELQVPGREPYNGFIDAIRKILRQEGMRGFYKGIIPALFLCSNGAIQFLVYEELKLWRLNETQNSIRAHEYMIMGAVSKAIASTITYPYQVIKCRMQQYRSEYKTTWKTFTATVRNQGLTGLFLGLVPNTLRVMPSSAVTFVVYEETKMLMESRINS